VFSQLYRASIAPQQQILSIVTRKIQLCTPGKAEEALDELRRHGDSVLKEVMQIE